jgi:DNA-binding MarR family transcriptional regulator
MERALAAIPSHQPSSRAIWSMESFRLVTAIRRLHLAIRAEIVEEVHALGFDDITPSHIYIFQTPGPNGARPTELARRALMTKQSMNHLLASLEKGGYLDRVEGGDDGRARVLQLTPKGHRFTTAIQEIAAAIEHRWAEQLGHPEIRHLTGSLAQLAELDGNRG